MDGNRRRSPSADKMYSLIPETEMLTAQKQVRLELIIKKGSIIIDGAL